MAIRYTIAARDTMSALASRFYGDSSLYPVIAIANRIADPNVIRVGQVLIVPGLTATHTVVVGDTLSGLAERFYGDRARFPLIAAANKLADPNTITVGQTLIIPDLTLAKHTLFCVPGTWEAVAAANGNPGGISPSDPIGMLTGITNALDPQWFDIEYVNYPASFGPVPGGGDALLDALGRPSYRASRDMGVAELTRLINAHDGSFGLLGYSQGGAVVSLVGRDIVSGSLQGRRGDCHWVHALASPHRGLGRTFHLGNSLAYQGISGDNITETHPIDWFDYCLPGDIYGNANIAGTYLKQAYDIATEFTLTDPVAMITGIAEHIVDWVNSGILGPIDPARLFATAVDLNNFLRDFPHDKYGIWDIIPERTALAHSAAHLNYWGPRIAPA
ncbi:LysM peptidoglycan-binding domain-containing protein [Nocardia fluminea]|uniref:LysM peptidoglycan-binding domain-containing protein n=1 Tax=Nocardia fluminea TaxID=134984 RepID=UPI0036518D44